MGKRLVEDCLILDLAWLMRLGSIRTGLSGSGEMAWSIDNQKLGAVHFRLDLRTAEQARLTLSYALTNADGTLQAKKQIIALQPTKQHFGGLRWWMLCPVTGKRVRTMLLPPQADHFVSRSAFGTAYRSERLTRFDRPFAKLFRVQRLLGGQQGLGAELKRPKGMWKRSFARHIDQLAQHDAACARQIGALIDRR